MLELFRFARTSCKAYEVRPSTRPQQFFLIHDNFHPFPSPIFFPSPPEKNFVPSSFCVFLLLHKDIFNLKMFLMNKYFPPFSSPSFLSSAKKDIFLLQIFSSFYFCFQACKGTLRSLQCTPATNFHSPYISSFSQEHKEFHLCRFDKKSNFIFMHLTFLLKMFFLRCMSKCLQYFIGGQDQMITVLNKRYGQMITV